MKSKQLSDWLQVMATIGVVAGLAFWKDARVVYMPEFGALVDRGVDGRANGLGIGWLKSIGKGAASEPSTE